MLYALPNADRSKGILSGVTLSGATITKVVAVTRPSPVDTSRGKSAVSGKHSHRYANVISQILDDAAWSRAKAHPESIQWQIYLFREVDLRESQWGAIEAALSAGKDVELAGFSSRTLSDLQSDKIFAVDIEDQAYFRERV